jgi:predicted lysophospholipase L1 biosynthesis ABC-type transport system permease subunit
MLQKTVSRGSFFDTLARQAERNRLATSMTISQYERHRRVIVAKSISFSVAFELMASLGLCTMEGFQLVDIR